MQLKYEDGRVADPNYQKLPNYPIWIEAIKVLLLFGAAAIALTYIAYDQAEASYRYMYFSLFFVIAPFLSTWIRRRTHNLVIFILLHGVMLCWLFLSPDLALTALGGLYLVLLTVYGAVRQASSQDEGDVSQLVLIFSMMGIICVYAMAVNRGCEGFIPVLIIEGLAYAALFLFYGHWTGIHDALGNIDKDGNFSTKRILQFNNKMLFVYMGAAVGVFALLYFGGLGDGLVWLGKQVMAGIRWVVGTLLNSCSGEEVVDPGVVGQEESASQGGSLVGADPSQFWLVAQHILEVVCVIAAIVGVIAAVVYLVRRFSRNAQYKEQGYEETKVFYKEVPAAKKRRRSLKELFDNSPESKIRRAYYKRVRHQMGKKVQPYETPTEVGAVLRDVEELVERYDEVRYARRGLSDENPENP